MLDTGITNYFQGTQTNILGTDDLNKINQGAIIEHLVGQELLSNHFNVKSGKGGSLKSLHLFMDEAPHDMALRFYSEGLSLTELTTPAGKPFLLLSLPYYLASQAPKYIGWLRSEGRAFLQQLKKVAGQLPPTDPPR